MSPYFYSVFGSRLSSAIPLPELRPASPGPVSWSFRVVDALAERPEAERLGNDRIYGDVFATMFRHSQGYRIVVDDTGGYDLLDHGATILWAPTEDPWWDFGRSHLLGKVLGAALHLGGMMALHASAVQMRDGVIGFLAPKHFGKSTLAISLVARGARLVTDDSLPVTPSTPALAYPGVQSLRLADADSLPPGLFPLRSDPVAGRDGKVQVTPLAETRVMAGAAPLSGLYLLLPTKPEPCVPAACRRRLPSIEAAIRLLGFSKVGSLLGSSFALELLDIASSVAADVPVYELNLVRDLERVGEVVDQLVRWHGLLPETLTSVRS